MEVMELNKEWKYGQFIVKAYLCNSCDTRFREYISEEKHKFTLKLEKGKGFTKV